MSDTAAPTPTTLAATATLLLAKYRLPLTMEFGAWYTAQMLFPFRLLAALAAWAAWAAWIAQGRLRAPSAIPAPRGSG